MPWGIDIEQTSLEDAATPGHVDLVLGGYSHIGSFNESSTAQKCAHGYGSWPADGTVPVLPNNVNDRISSREDPANWPSYSGPMRVTVMQIQECFTKSWTCI